MCAHYIASRRLQPVQQCALLRTGCAARPKTKTVTADAVFGARPELLIPGSVLTEERMSYMIGEDAFSSDDRFLAQVRDQDRKVVYQIAGKLIHKGKNHKNDRVRLCVGVLARTKKGATALRRCEGTRPRHTVHFHGSAPKAGTVATLLPVPNRRAVSNA